MKRVRLMLVGGFLGAGKTTLLARTAGLLARRGLRVGLITNDQAEDLVDTGLLAGAGLDVSEIPGGCFCCRFTSLVEAGEQLIRRMQPDVLIGEPVGSCTDLVATVLRPLERFYGEWFVVSPLTVLADPDRLAEALGLAEPTFPDSILYIFRKQIEEADLLLLNKADLLAPARRDELLAAARRTWPGRETRAVSARTGEGLDDWLDALDAADPAGRRVVEVDYDTYADGEALLGWYNGAFLLHAPTRPPDWTAVVRSAVGAVADRLARDGARIAHLKALLQTSGGSVSANVTRTGGPVDLRGAIGRHGRWATLTVNARVHHDPDALAESVAAAVTALADAGLEVRPQRVSSFRPGRPQPVHRIASPAD